MNWIIIGADIMTWSAERGLCCDTARQTRSKCLHRAGFNRMYRTEVLNAYVFESLDQSARDQCRVVTDI